MKALVTGGGGFLGKAIVAKLLERGDTVRSFARGDYPELSGWGVETMRGDLADPEAVMRAHEGCDIVFHVAGKPDMWGPYDAYRLTNLVGTDNVIAACRTQGVRRLVYTSTPSVVHAGGDIEGADESLAYAQRFTSPYPETKAEAERHVLLANGATLATVAIRPHLVWGPGDNHLIPRLLERARLGRLRYIGREDKLIDTTYVDNAADAHLAAGDRLAPEADCAGKAYFLSQGDPWPASRISNAILAAAGLPPVTRRLPTWFAYGLGAILESAYRMLRIEAEPAVTRFLVQQMSTAHWYDISAARRDLGYEPRISIEEGFAKLRLHFEREARGGTSSHGGQGR